MLVCKIAHNNEIAVMTASGIALILMGKQIVSTNIRKRKRICRNTVLSASLTVIWIPSDYFVEILCGDKHFFCFTP